MYHRFSTGLTVIPKHKCNINRRTHKAGVSFRDSNWDFAFTLSQTLTKASSTFLMSHLTSTIGVKEKQKFAKDWTCRTNSKSKSHYSYLLGEFHVGINYATATNNVNGYKLSALRPWSNNSPVTFRVQILYNDNN